ncbi:hypothetical protein [Oceanobacillus sp. FSL H7-0719]|uniref:hypothetical protein n=1 Tax=Oceanobacillus sp. FSL H7-0719 TaxID=2954507 RepID=UPI00324EB883
MKNEVVGCLFFCFLVLGVALGYYFNHLQLFSVLGLGLGLVIVFFFRKKVK